MKEGDYICCIDDGEGQGASVALQEAHDRVLRQEVWWMRSSREDDKGECSRKRDG